MKRLKAGFEGLMAAFTGTLLALPAWAQTATNPGGTVSSTTTTTSTSNVWYAHWWPWAVLVAVFLIVVIALTNRGGRTSS